MNVAQGTSVISWSTNVSQSWDAWSGSPETELLWVMFWQPNASWCDQNSEFLMVPRTITSFFLCLIYPSIPCLILWDPHIQVVLEKTQLTILTYISCMHFCVLITWGIPKWICFSFPCLIQNDLHRILPGAIIMVKTWIFLSTILQSLCW